MLVSLRAVPDARRCALRPQATDLLSSLSSKSDESEGGGSLLVSVVSRTTKRVPLNKELRNVLLDLEKASALVPECYDRSAERF